MSKDDDYVSSGYVAGAVDEDHDYTKSDSGNPIKIPDEITEDDGFDAVDLAPDVKADEIEKGSYRYLGPGEWVVCVKDVVWSDKGEPIHNKVHVKSENGEVHPDFFFSRRCKVTFCLPDDENNTVNDMFLVMPPKEQMEAFTYGYSKEDDAKKNPRTKGGFHCKKLKHFLARLGFQEDSEGRLPAAAGRFINWLYYPGTKIRRRIKLEVQKGKQQPDKIVVDENGNKKTITPPIYNQVKMYSYALVEPPAEVLVAQRKAILDAQKAAAEAVKPQASEPKSEPVQDDPSATKTTGKGKKKPAGTHV
jgi:hypothetical protein